MKNKVLSTHRSSFRRTLDDSTKVIVFIRTEYWESGSVATFVDAVEDAASGKDITSKFSNKKLGELVFYALAFPTCK